ncbi:helix-turn-helix domain-containing protein [Pedobacter lithocola]|uniref:Helix-turn-helix domain-containing protein n=1 Tax=Pedobacter lithocola TaxID=1908239 RepID=A0ABV8PBC3_9SPHI
MADQHYYNLLYSCEAEHRQSSAQLVSEHALSLIISGESHLYTSRGKEVFGKGTIGLVRRNQLIKAIKVHGPDGVAFRAINIFLDQESLRSYSAKNNVGTETHYTGEPLILLPDDPFLKGFFLPLVPYFDHPEQLTKALSDIKTKEAIELLLRDPNLKKFLFDFSEPFKIDLDTFMNKNYMFNVAIKEFARLTGRSLATFKRDFKKTFDQTPETWIRQRRLEQAHFLISVKNQNPSSVYLDVGFENLSHFSQAFKLFFGYNPSAIPLTS